MTVVNKMIKTLIDVKIKLYDVPFFDCHLYSVVTRIMLKTE